MTTQTTHPEHDEELIEKLAAIEHERWADWQKWMHDVCLRQKDGCLVIPAVLVERWERQIKTPYAELSEANKHSDREQVMRYWPLIAAHTAKEVEAARRGFADQLKLAMIDGKASHSVSRINEIIDQELAAAENFDHLNSQRKGGKS